jgi:hypothetical protein
MEDDDIKINSLNINKLYINYQKLSKSKDTANNLITFIKMENFIKFIFINPFFNIK